MPFGKPIVNIGKLVSMATARPSGRTDFGQRMYEARTAAGLSQVEVCKRLGISQSTLSEAERLASGSSHTVRFASLYDVSAAWLANGVEPRAPNAAASAPLDEPFSRAAMLLARDFDSVPAGPAKEVLYQVLRDQIRRAVAGLPALIPDLRPISELAPSVQKVPAPSRGTP